MCRVGNRFRHKACARTGGVVDEPETRSSNEAATVSIDTAATTTTTGAVPVELAVLMGAAGAKPFCMSLMPVPYAGAVDDGSVRTYTSSNEAYHQSTRHFRRG